MLLYVVLYVPATMHNTVLLCTLIAITTFVDPHFLVWEAS